MRKGFDWLNQMKKKDEVKKMDGRRTPEKSQ